MPVRAAVMPHLLSLAGACAVISGRPEATMFKSATAATAVSLVLALGLAAAASAQEVCVTCSDPDVSYKCSIKDSEKASNVRGANKAIEFLCITELARQGGHRSCRASRDYVGPCIGQPRQIDLARSTVPQGPAVDNGTQEETKPAEEPRRAAGQPPRTLEEMAREGAQKSKQQLEAADQSMKQAAKDAGKTLEKAGSAVGDAFKKTGTAVGEAVNKSGEVVKKSVVCIVTLFTSCGQQKEEPEK